MFLNDLELLIHEKHVVQAQAMGLFHNDDIALAYNEPFRDAALGSLYEGLSVAPRNF